MPSKHLRLQVTDKKYIVVQDTHKSFTEQYLLLWANDFSIVGILLYH